MRYIIKGGVWKNSEDEILKAAVMKYGLNQWSRISSLLVRKSAKQCKQRWYEWLDPQIKKTEWTREEDEKLLHLAKIFPCQWRTIAPIVNRTPNQCVDRYERLLDIAQGKDPDDPNDPRKLKPGEIDPNPETKPAKADPIDMDEDQKEMLAEARVRLANTMGKKPKRLAREKLIEDARRQAQLQKRTELKAAGIEIIGKKKLKGLNYNAEIPFERIIPEKMFKNPKEETPQPNLNFQNLSLRDIEGKMRIEEEEKLRKIDEKRIKKLKENELEKVVEKMNQKTKEILSQSTKLVMPSPQLQDKDLEILGKINNFQQLTTTDNEITKGLMGTYSQREMPLTQMRTPRYQDQLLNEAKNLIALNQTQTPLVGGQNPQLIEEKQVFSNSVQFKIPQTPNNLKKIIEDQKLINQGFALPASKRRYEQQQDTPFRDQFGLHESIKSENEIHNTNGWENQSQYTEDSQFMQKNSQQILKENIFNLPKPQNEYQFEIPDFEAEEDLEKQKRNNQMQKMNINLK
ncbi:myb-like DNA-binding domain protein [Ichthyophthirius multifiliis]|uniref:Myb-like DNA-binding domain protein n=1 Tax=Ichthyophthirius multifiliis TaxID=5932 RepID=G0QWI6_ICHMU|nr:myb-like DNA-binding domain protein [Ichthyophthirius multifiliis]EGR30415.1 myb-like DNA-binding domain protein [Ichthyophthirius multifiliis]|eukprot:XP_004032002.1 myb-like DNA-binding domain protein [Ichthyophthirius multifiliis]